MTAFLDWLAQRKKAIAGLVGPGVPLFLADVADGSWPTTHEWDLIALACVVSGLVVHFAPTNTPAPIEGD